VVRVNVDISVFSAYLAQGTLHGSVEVPALPIVGETVSFAVPIKEVPLPTALGFTPNILVEHVFPATPEIGGVPLLSLADVNVITSAEAEAVFACFERGFDLFADRFQVVSHE
jgi:hypothetical protein